MKEAGSVFNKTKIQKEYRADNNTPIFQVGKLMADHKLKTDDILSGPGHKFNSVQ